MKTPQRPLDETGTSSLGGPDVTFSATDPSFAKFMGVVLGPRVGPRKRRSRPFRRSPLRSL